MLDIRIQLFYTCNTRTRARTAVLQTGSSVLPPTGLSAVHTNSTTIRLYWTPPTATPTGYKITYFAGAEDTTGTALSVSGGSTDSHEIPNLSATVTYRVSIVSVNGTTRSATTGPVLAARAGPSLALKGAVFPNHGVLRRDPSVIGKDEDALYCVTDNVACCGTPPSVGDGGSGNGRGDWHFPDDRQLTSGTANAHLWYASWLTGAVLMNFRGTATTGTTGLHRCDIRDSMGTLHQFYTCFYDNNAKCVVMKADPLQFSLHTTPTADPPMFTLTCVSTGGPVTTVNWTRDGAAATGVTSQTVVDQEAITYNNTLTVTGRLLGDYQCSVANVRTAQPAIASLTVAGASAPDVSRVAVSGPSSITVSWNIPDVNTSYVAYYQLLQGEEDNKTVSSSAGELTIDGLQPDRLYTVRVLALSQHLPSPLSGPIQIKVAVPEAPTVTVERVNGTHINVTWEELSPADARGDVVSYSILYTPATRQGEDNVVVVTGNQSSVLIGGLDPQQTYTVQVWATTAAGDGMRSDPVEAIHQRTGSSAGVIVGIVIAAVTGVIAVGVIVVVISCLHRRGNLSCAERPVRKKSLSYGSKIVRSEGVELKAVRPAADKKMKGKPSKATVDTVSSQLNSIPVSELPEYVRMVNREVVGGFKDEYGTIPKEPQAESNVAVIPCNRKRNRFANTFPYDFNRVKLKAIEGEEGSDYINASFVDGYVKKQQYIATQGPLPQSLADFLRLIWEQRLPTVVMVTQCVEAGKRKCEQYWPERVGETISPDGGVSVLLKSVLPFAEYEIRELVLTNPKEPSVSPLKVSQVAYLAWPDHGVPANAMSLINFIRRIRKLHPPTHQQPLLVHCSAGVGRTGTFIVLDSMMQRIAAEDSVNIHQFVCQLRSQRPLLVQTVSQYKFIYEALSELVMCGETEIEAGSLRIRMHQLQALDSGGTLSGYQQQHQALNELSIDRVDPNEEDYSDATLPSNLHKNRYKSKLPRGPYRVRLPHTPASEEGEDYINASHVHGYRAWNAYMATQGPLKKTTGDFWRMVLERGSRCIVMLCRLTEGGKEACHCYWPRREGGSVDYEGLTVTLHSEQDRGDYVIRKLEVAAGVGSSLSVTQFHYTAWPGPSSPPSSPSSLLELLEDVIKVQQTTGNKTITVMCNDGVGRTGTFICLHAQLERLKTEGVVDFFQYIKSARIHRAGLVDCVEQYIFCHDSVALYLDSFDTYANFKELI